MRHDDAPPRRPPHMTPDVSEQFWAPEEDERVSKIERNWQGEALRGQAENEALRFRLKETQDERDRAREECGHAKAMRASITEEMYRFVGFYQEQRGRAEKAESANARVRGIVEHAQAHGYDLDHVEILQALDGLI